MFFDENHLQDLPWLTTDSSRVDKEADFRDYDNLQLCSFSQVCFGYLRHFLCSYKFYNFLFYFCEKCPEDFERDCIEFVDCFR